MIFVKIDRSVFAFLKKTRGSLQCFQLRGKRNVENMLAFCEKLTFSDWLRPLSS